MYRGFSREIPIIQTDRQQSYQDSETYRGNTGIDSMSMYPFNPQLYHHAPVSTASYLRSHDITLTLRQQPKEALVTTEGKEKARKPVDPPPIIQLTVKPQADPAQHFLQSPYLFMCTSLYKCDKNEAWEGNGNKSLAGSLVSSLHRLKDVDNKDGGFFVFGDISVKVQGSFRLHFSLFDLRKDTQEVVFLGSITSEPFRVLLPKDFKGMDESTYLSRAFSDQGVRLRLRKEPRAMIGNKRGYPYGGVDTSVPNTPIRPSIADSAYYGEDSRQSPAKRYRTSEGEDIQRKVEYADQSNISFPAYSQPHYPVRHASISGASMGSLQSMPQFPGFGAVTDTNTPHYQFRPTLPANVSNMMAEPLLPTSTAGSMAPQGSLSQAFTPYGQPSSWTYMRGIDG